MVPALRKPRRNCERATHGRSARTPYGRPLRFEPLEDRRMLALFTVANLDDSGEGSLRDAIAQANSMAGADDIDFAAGLSGGTITLTSGELVITQSLTIDATALAQSVTIDANHQSRIFNFTAGSGNLTLMGLTITRGRTTGDNGPTPMTTFSGGAVRFASTGTLTVASSLIAGSSTQGVFAIGGAIYSNGALVLRDSTVSGNQTQGILGWGGGIAAGNMTITRSTITANHSNDSGGGVANLSGASTVSGSIVAGNTTAATGPDVYIFSGTVGANYSLIGDTEGSGISGGEGNVLNQPAGLGPLADNGGATRTHALLLSSLAINAGDPAAMIDDGVTPDYDQRGAPFSRVLGGRIDIGAFEAESIALVVGTLDDESDGNFAPSDLSLREALEVANLRPGADTVSFNPSLAGGTILLTLGQLEISSELSLVGLGASQIMVDAQGSSRVLSVSGSADAQISGVTLTGGNADVGGAVRVHPTATATLTSVVIADNDASQGGGGVLNSGQLTIVDSTIRDNTGTSGFAGGGGIRNNGDLEIRRSIISGNDAGANALGGGVLHGGGELMITASTLSGNSAGYGGGGVGNLNAYDLTISNSTLSGNMARYGGGVFNRYGTTTISGSTLTGNMADYGGGIFADGYGTVVLNHAIVSGNTAPTGSEIRAVDGEFALGNYNLLGHSGATLAGALDGVASAGTDITATSDGDDPTPLAGILKPALANHGGPTLMHALVPGSPALDAGSLAAMPGQDGVPDYDQRGWPWTRVSGAQIDIGAFEAQPNPLPGDYNFDQRVDAGDYVTWRNTLGEMEDLRADGSGPTPGVPDDVVDELDYAFWKLNYGNTLTMGSGGLAGQAGGVPAASDAAADAADEFFTAPVPIGHSLVTAPYLGRQTMNLRLVAVSAPRSEALLAWVVAEAADRPWDGGDDAELVESETDPVVSATAFDEAFELLGKN